MKQIIILLFFGTISFNTVAQTTDKQKVERACLDYLEGFYEGDTTKLIRSLKPSLYKFGYWRSDKTGKYDGDGQMTFKEALAYANNVRMKKNFAKPTAPKEVIVFEVAEHIASAKVTAWWGIDYILLARDGDKWIIEQVLWEGPPKK
jgi:hypothetical protein